MSNLLHELSLEVKALDRQRDELLLRTAGFGPDALRCWRQIESRWHDLSVQLAPPRPGALALIGELNAGYAAIRGTLVF